MELLEHYGFLLPENLHDEAVVPLDLWPMAVDPAESHNFFFHPGELLLLVMMVVIEHVWLLYVGLASGTVRSACHAVSMSLQVGALLGLCCWLCDVTFARLASAVLPLMLCEGRRYLVAMRYKWSSASVKCV